MAPPRSNSRNRLLGYPKSFGAAQRTEQRTRGARQQRDVGAEERLAVSEPIAEMHAGKDDSNPPRSHALGWDRIGFDLGGSLLIHTLGYIVIGTRDLEAWRG